MKYLYPLFYLCVLLILPPSAKGQALFNEKYNDCIGGKPCYYCGDVNASYKKNIRDRLQYNLDHGLQKWMGTSGHIYFEIEVDSTGHSCVRSIKDETHMQDIKNTLRICINGLYDWQPAISNGRPTTSSVILELHFLGNRASVSFIKPDDL